MGTFAGFANWLAIAMKAAFAIVGLGSLITYALPASGEWVVKLVAVGACLFFTVLNLVSVKGSGRFQVILVFGLFAILGVVSAKGLTAVEETRFIPFLPYGFQSVFAVAGVVFVSFGGLAAVVDVSEEIRDPGRILPLGMFAAFGIVNLLYVLVVFVVVGALPSEELSGTLHPVADAAGVFLGPVGMYLTSVAAFLAFATTANAGLLAAARTPMAMGRDGLVPAALSRTSKRFGTPHIAILFTSALMSAAILLLSIEDLVKMASTILIILFMLASGSVIIMRTSGLQNYRPRFRAPLSPWLQIAALVAYVFIIIEMGWFVLGLTAAFALATFLWYLAYVHWRIEQVSGFVNLVRRIAGVHFGRSGLEEELKQLALERDEVELDRFDRLVAEGTVLDIEKQVTGRQLFETVACTLAERTGEEEGSVLKTLIERERESSTIVQPGIAIPHIILDRPGVFELVLVRCREGAVFSELAEPVEVVFALAGSRDERNFHLRALMSIAHIVQEEGFRERWKAAKGEEGLRDVLLLSRRERHAH